MNYQHKQLAAGRWMTMSFVEQMANVGSEIERSIRWKNKDNREYSLMAFERALELLDLTTADLKNKHHLKELLRVREMLSDYFVFNNEYHSDDKAWQNYFYSFNFAARAGL